jgi:biofilm PGA synthesis N-glycosyltransferase PgaC
MSILLSLWFSFAIVQLVYWGLIFQRIAWYKVPKSSEGLSHPAVSIIICARNEAANLQKNLESILIQDYSIYEVILVDDDSDDETTQVLAIFEEKYEHLKVVRIKDKKGQGKKNALTSGILAAQYDWILLTDADCNPCSNSWISEMSQSAGSTKSDIVLGYGPYSRAKSWLNRWVQFETIYVAIQYFSFALWKQPYMGVGRNLMYKKALFFDNEGFENHKHLTSGDDDLFVNAVANSTNTAICLKENAFMYSPSPKSWAELYRQKKRHYSSSSHYKLYHKALLGLLSLSHLCFYAGLFVIIGTNAWNSEILVLFILRTFLLHLVFIRYLSKTNRIELLPYLWLLDVLVPVYYLIFASALVGGNQKKWK